MDKFDIPRSVVQLFIEIEVFYDTKFRICAERLYLPMKEHERKQSHPIRALQQMNQLEKLCLQGPVR
jgi:hypothetical protein